MRHAHPPEPRVPGDPGAREERGPDVGPAEVLRAEERGRSRDEPGKGGTEDEVHGEAERDVVGARESPGPGECRDEDPPEQREGRERERRVGGAQRDRDGDIGHGVASPIHPPATQPPEGRPEKDDRRERRGDGGSGNGPLVVGVRLERAHGGEVRPQIQGTVSHEQAQDREVDEEDQRREPAEPLRPGVDLGAGPLTTCCHRRGPCSERGRAR